MCVCVCVCVCMCIVSVHSFGFHFKNYSNLSQWEFALCLRELKRGLCVNLEGWDGEGDGREVREGGDICIPMADSC